MKDSIHESQRYRQVGDQIETILAERDMSVAGFVPEKPRNFAAILALVTLFQYVEGYTDKQAAEAARARMDWKYALGLPLSYPGFEPVWLCRFRAFAFGSLPGRAFIQSLADRLGKIGLFEPDPLDPDVLDPTLSGPTPNPGFQAIEILNSNCQLNRMVQITEAVLLAVEALAVQESTCLPALRIAKLYESYAKTFRSLRQIRTSEEAARFAGRVGAEIASLLASVEASGEEDLVELPEIDHLRKIWETQYNRLETGRLSEPAFIWRPVDCHHCSLYARADVYN